MTFITLILASLPFLASATLMPRNEWPLMIYAGASIITFLLYARDKQKAKKKLWRIPESVLHLFALLGGWPGALIAKRFLRHKNRKLGFQINLYSIVALHLIFWVDYLFLKLHITSYLKSFLNL